MREATAGKYPRYAVWENVCFDSDTLITCEDGYRRIADISVGQKVKTLSGRYLPVMKVHQTKKQEVIRLSVQGSEDLTVTPNHPFYAMRKVRYKKGIQTLVGPEWVSAGELTKDHLIAYGIDHPTLPDCFISETEAWAVGRWLADGSVDLKKTNPRIFLSIGIGKEELAREMLGRLPYAVYENKPHATATNFCFTSKEFYSLIVDAGIGAGNKRIPPYVFQLPRHLQRAVLDGYISGDLGDGFSVAYRVLDAQYWGVPQRRARIYLVADFDGGSAGEVLFKSEGLSGYTPQGFGAWEGTAGGVEKGAGEAGGRPDAGSGDGRYCLNPQGCSGITLTEEQTGTLVAQDHGHHPAVLQSAGFSTEHSAQSRSIGYEEEKSPTLRAGVVPATMMFDNHAQDARYDGPMEHSPTVTARYGSGGNNQPLVAEPEPMTLKNRCGRPGGGMGLLVPHDKSATLGCNNDQTHIQPAYGIAKEAFNAGEKAGFNFAVNEEVSPTIQAHGSHAVARPEIRAFGVCSKQSHSMLSDNPHSGFYEAKTSRTLDQSGGHAVCSNQGGICVVAPDPAYALQGSMIGRADKNGPQGDGINEDVSFTLNTVDKHAVAQPTYCATTGSFMTISKDKTQPLMARDYKDPQIINDRETPEEPVYIVRRLTPTECARLQGFPDWWCSGLAIENPTDADTAYWLEVWNTWQNLTGGKPKNEAFVKRWLKDPYTESAVYKLYGNGVALPCVHFVLAGIVWAANRN